MELLTYRLFIAAFADSQTEAESKVMEALNVWNRTDNNAQAKLIENQTRKWVGENHSGEPGNHEVRLELTFETNTLLPRYSVFDATRFITVSGETL